MCFGSQQHRGCAQGLPWGRVGCAGSALGPRASEYQDLNTAQLCGLRRACAAPIGKGQPGASPAPAGSPV